jgi:hypothetical protein
MPRSSKSWRVRWIDRGLEPKSPPNPKYPDGIELRLTKADYHGPTCCNSLPYPAKRVGYFMIECMTCGQHAVVTTAGRPDDPCSLEMACKVH